jgi:hypothetical protein
LARYGSKVWFPFYLERLYLKWFCTGLPLCLGQYSTCKLVLLRPLKYPRHPYLSFKEFIKTPHEVRSEGIWVWSNQVPFTNLKKSSCGFVLVSKKVLIPGSFFLSGLCLHCC